MSIKSCCTIIKNIFQDSVIRIPYYLSPIKSTSVLCISIQPSSTSTSTSSSLTKSKLTQQQYIDNLLILNSNNNNNKNNNEGQLELGILGHQYKLYYQKDIVYKSVIIQFQNVEYAEKFYIKYAKNYDKSYISTQANINANIKTNQQQQKQSKQPTYKFPIFFCKNITTSPTNMQQILYNFGKISIQPPDTFFLKSIIKQVAKLIVVQGIRGQQQIIKNKQQVLGSASNLLDFMDGKFMASEAYYYRWRVYSYLQGDGESNYRMMPFQMTDNGPVYYPPEENSDKYAYRIMTHQERNYISKLLEVLTPRKFHIEEAMAFCISNVGSAVQICSIIAICVIESCKKLSMEEGNAGSGRHTQIKHVIGLFYLISDILFNSPSTIYRDIFTFLLPPLIQKIPKIIDLNTKISQIVQNWNKKFIMQQQFLRGLALSSKCLLPSMHPLGMQQMTRSQHESYKNLIQIQSAQQIQQMCWKYGIAFNFNRINQAYRNLAAVLSQDNKEKEGNGDMEPEVGPYDGQPLNQKDILKIKSKNCRVVSCQDVPVKYLFQKEKNSKSISYD